MFIFSKVIFARIRAATYRSNSAPYRGCGPLMVPLMVLLELELQRIALIQRLTAGAGL